MGAPTDRQTVHAIVDDYRRGDLVKDIAARHNVSDTVVSKYAHRAGLSRPKVNTDMRPQGPCIHCGRPCRARYGACRSCRIYNPYTPDPDDALTDGHWRPRPGSGGVQEWVPDAVVMSRTEWSEIEQREAS